MGRILVIDDEDMIRAMLREALEMVGHEVSEASDGEKGMRMVGGCGSPVRRPVLITAR